MCSETYFVCILLRPRAHKPHSTEILQRDQPDHYYCVKSEREGRVKEVGEKRNINVAGASTRPVMFENLVVLPRANVRESLDNMQHKFGGMFVKGHNL